MRTVLDQRFSQLAFQLRCRSDAWLCTCHHLEAVAQHFAVVCRQQLQMAGQQRQQQPQPGLQQSFWATQCQVHGQQPSLDDLPNSSKPSTSTTTIWGEQQSGSVQLPQQKQACQPTLVPVTSHNSSACWQWQSCRSFATQAGLAAKRRKVARAIGHNSYNHQHEVDGPAPLDSQYQARPPRQQWRQQQPHLHDRPAFTNEYGMVHNQDAADWQPSMLHRQPQQQAQQPRYRNPSSWQRQQQQHNSDKYMMNSKRPARPPRHHQDLQQQHQLGHNDDCDSDYVEDAASVYTGGQRWQQEQHKQQRLRGSYRWQRQEQQQYQHQYQQGAYEKDKYQQEQPQPPRVQHSSWRQMQQQQHVWDKLEQQQQRQPGFIDGSDVRRQKHASGSSSSSSSRETWPNKASRTADGAISPARLTQLVSSCESLTELHNLIKQHLNQMQQISICAAYKALVRLSAQTARNQRSSSSFGDSSNSDGSSNEDGVALMVMQQLCGKMQSQMRVSRPWDLAQAAWACSKVHYRDGSFLNAIADQAQRRAPILLPRDISQLASAFARMEYKHPQLAQLLLQQAVVKAQDFEPWSLVHTAWALHMLGVDCKGLLLAVVQHLPGKCDRLQPLDVATLLWLMADQGFYNQALLDQIAKAATATISKYAPEQLSQTLISFAGLGFCNADMVAAAAQLVEGQMQHYSPKQVAHSTFAMVKLDHASLALLDAAATAFLQKPESFSPQMLCMLCWAHLLSQQQQQECNRVQEAFVLQLIQQVSLQLPKFAADQLASIVRGLYRISGRFASSSQIQSAVQHATADVHAHLPPKLQGMATPVLAQLVRTLANRLQYTAGATRRYTSKPATTSSSSSSEQAQGDLLQQQAQQQPDMLVLLQQCGREWLSATRQNNMTVQQASAVATALNAAGLFELAAAADEVHRCVKQRVLGAHTSLAGSEEQQQHVLNSLDVLNSNSGFAAEVDAHASSSSSGSNSRSVANRGGGSSWLDNFVATSSDGSDEQ